MKFLIFLLIVCLVVSFLVVQPVTLIGTKSTRLMLHIGKTVPLVGIAEVAGGYRCYVNSDEYFWLSASKCIQAEGDITCVVFRINELPILYRSGLK